MNITPDVSQPAATFTSKSLLYWLSGALALGISLVGLLALFAPATGSAMFGIPAAASESLPWIRLAGIRDVALGLVLFTMMARKEGRTAGILILLLLVVPIADLTTVFSRTGLNYHMLIHACGALFMAVIGVLLLKSQ